MLLTDVEGGFRAELNADRVGLLRDLEAESVLEILTGIKLLVEIPLHQLDVLHPLERENGNVVGLVVSPHQVPVAMMAPEVVGMDDSVLGLLRLRSRVVHLDALLPHD